ncbi:hypothetical protein SAMN04488072_104267 [Lentibacillus halodurans]|uniref:Uncharacterized protein n=1 Tax=Lentibacillus halodurans TaxID=237679 RepID=A0A1I0XB89_9BACI|nr:hypothetical protein [Lentibacillus halodurans]SFA97686.1 hypothetical protein SAMN04488072_104267 [Lentibacillus halodurans]
MESFLQVQESVEEQLGRELQDNELAFLQWVYERYTEEEKRRVNVSQY